MKANYDYLPQECSLYLHDNYVDVTVTANVVKHVDEEGRESWEADENRFTERVDKIDLDDVRANPSNYLEYVTWDFRDEAKKEAQVLLDTFRDGLPIVPVPSYREDAAVCNRPADQIKLLGGLSFGGLPYYELASGEIVSLSSEDIKNIALDITQAETMWQQAKQECWNSIDVAKSEQEVSVALNNFTLVLKQYA